MSKQKKLLIASLYLVFSFLIAVDIICFVFDVFSALAFGICLGIGLIGVAVTTFLMLALNKRKGLKGGTAFDERSFVGASKTDLYTILGIPVQYNKDGSVKDIYELLGIEPVFDENGQRLPTVYEQLDIVPFFDENGNEVPYVFVIKNRVARVAKVDLTSRILTRRLSERELEEKAINEAIRRKLDEVREAGEKSQEAALKKMLEQPKVSSVKTDKGKTDKKGGAKSKKPVVYKQGKGAKGVSTPVLKSLRGSKIATAFVAAATLHQPKPTPKAPDKPMPTPKQEQPQAAPTQPVQPIPTPTAQAPIHPMNVPQAPVPSAPMPQAPAPQTNVPHPPVPPTNMPQAPAPNVNNGTNALAGGDDEKDMWSVRIYSKAPPKKASSVTININMDKNEMSSGGEQPDLR